MLSTGFLLKDTPFCVQVGESPDFLSPELCTSVSVICSQLPVPTRSGLLHRDHKSRRKAL